MISDKDDLVYKWGDPIEITPTLGWDPNKHPTSKLGLLGMLLHYCIFIRKTVRTAILKSADGFRILPDKRGTHPNRAFDEETFSAVKDHIKSFPVMESHYVREGKKRQYLSPELNVEIMYRLFIETNPKVKVGIQTNRNIFNKYFNLGFHKPKKDKCEICNAIENAPPGQLTVIKKKHQDHLFVT